MIEAPWIITASGRGFVLGDANSPVAIEDIAHALARICRWTGHVESFYSVGEHSLHVCEQVLAATAELDDAERARCGLWALLHDASEAYIGDVSTPLKRYLRGTALQSIYDQLERTTMLAIRVQLGLEGEQPAIVSHFDAVLAATEARDVLANAALQPEWVTSFPYEPLPRRLQSMPIQFVERAIVAMYEQLKQGTPVRRILSA